MHCIYINIYYIMNNMVHSLIIIDCFYSEFYNLSFIVNFVLYFIIIFINETKKNLDFSFLINIYIVYLKQIVIVLLLLFCDHLMQPKIFDICVCVCVH